MIQFWSMTNRIILNNTTDVTVHFWFYMNSVAKIVQNWPSRVPYGGEGPINNSSSRRNDFTQYYKVGWQPEWFSIKIYPEAPVVFTVVRFDQIFCFNRNIFQNYNFGMLALIDLMYIQQPDQTLIDYNRKAHCTL